VHFEIDNVSGVWYTCGISRERRSEMNLEEYKAYVLETRRQSTVSVVSAIINSSTKKEGSK